MLVLVIAFLVGQHSGAGDVSAADGPVAGGRGAPAAAPSGMMAAVATTGPAAPTAAPSPVAEPAPVAPVATARPAPAAPAVPPTRQVGMMYIVLQSYPDRETARRAGTFLDRHGVPCTVVPGLNGFALRDWYSVVGLQPIDRSARGQALQTYLEQLTALGPQFSAKAYNQFQPQPYTWQVNSDAPRP